MTHRARALAALFALASCAFILTACGGGGGGGASAGGSAQQLLKETFGQHHRISSGKLAFSLKISGDGGPLAGKPITASVSGPFQSTGKGNVPKGDIAGSFSGAGKSFTGGLISTGDQGFVKVGSNSYQVPPNVFAAFKQRLQKAATQQSASAGKLSLSKLGIKPLDWLRNAKVVGDADVAGASTVRVTSDVDVKSLLADLSKAASSASSLGLTQGSGSLPTGIPSSVRDQVSSAIKTAKVDVYTGKADKTLRKLVLNLVIDVPQSAQTQAGGLKSVTVALSFQLADLNQPQAISAPANAKPLSQLSGGGALGGVLGGSGGAGSSSGGSGLPGGAPSVAKQRAFQRCILGAAGDQVKQRKCVALLTK